MRPPFDGHTPPRPCLSRPRLSCCSRALDSSALSEGATVFAPDLARDRSDLSENFTFLARELAHSDKGVSMFKALAFSKTWLGKLAAAHRSSTKIRRPADFDSGFE